MSSSRPLPLVASDPAPVVQAVATAADCLRCQLIGRRRLLCAQADACKRLPHVMALGPALLALWAATVLAFVWTAW